MDLDFFFFPPFQHQANYRHERKRNGVEIKSVRPDDVLFPLFPMQISIPKSITLRWMERSLKSKESRGGKERIWPQNDIREAFKGSFLQCLCG